MFVKHAEEQAAKTAATPPEGRKAS
jgi:hypothetical protein